MKSKLQLLARWAGVAFLRALVGVFVLLGLIQGGCAVVRCGPSLCIGELFDDSVPPHTLPESP